MPRFARTLTFPLLALFLLAALPAQADRLLDRVAAVVNDEIILQSELEMRTRETAQELMAKQIRVNNLPQLQSKVLDNLILEVLQKQRAKQLGLSVSDEEVNQQLTQIATQNRMSLLDLRKRLNAQSPNGFLKLRSQVQQKLLIQKLRQKEVISRTLVTEEEINNYLQRSRLDTRNTELHLRHILITFPESATTQQREQARKKINSLADRIRSGESFSQLAVRHSNGSKALSGGDLGWLKQEQIPTFFTEAIQNLQPGEVSPVITSPSGFHLIKLEGERDADQQLITQYHLHRFIILSDQALQQESVPLDIQKMVADTDSLQAFENLKTEYSDIPEEVNAHSDLGWKTLDELPIQLRESLLTIEAGQIAEPVATEQGWVLFFLEEQRQQDVNKANEQQQAIQEIRMRKANETFEIWLRRLKDEAFIDIRI